jgi:hypothetical protein
MEMQADYWRKQVTLAAQAEEVFGGSGRNLSSQARDLVIAWVDTCFVSSTETTHQSGNGFPLVINFDLKVVIFFCLD